MKFRNCGNYATGPLHPTHYLGNQAQITL